MISGAKITERHRILPHAKAPKTSDKAVATRELGPLMHETVSLHVRADVPTGLFLSGGIDSSCLITVMARLSDKPVTALTAAFPDSKANDESDKAKRVAEAVGADLR